MHIRPTFLATFFAAPMLLTAVGAVNADDAPAVSPAAASDYTVLYRFRGGAQTRWPRGGVALDSSGNVLGTTLYDGKCMYCGGVYKLTKPKGARGAWDFDLIYPFSGDYRDGRAPISPLTIVGNKIYGTSSAGADPSCGCGEVFEMTPSGSKYSYKILHRFNNKEGTTPVAGLLADSDGTLYGTTSGGGKQASGVLYKITPGGTFSVMHDFADYNGQQTAGPSGELIFGKDGAIYGTAFGGGNYNQGTVFRITRSGKHTVIYNFLGVNQPGGSHDGAQPEGRLALGSDGTIYGTTAFGGTPSGYGTAWSITPKSGGRFAYEQLYIFGQNNTEPNLPHSGLVIDSKGVLYGTGAGGGTEGSGTLYQMSKSGRRWGVRVLYSFKGRSPTGDTPYADIVLSGRTLYGSTLTGGTINSSCNNGCGVVWSFKL